MSQARVVVVTGAAGNVGAALCEVLSSRGCRVVAVERTAAPPRGAGAPALVLAAPDLADPECAEAVIARAAERMGRIDAVVNTVGGFAHAPLAEAGPELWERLFRVNLLTTLALFRAALPRLRAGGGGNLVAIAAGAALRAGAGFAPYAAAKSAVLRLVESAAAEGRHARIRANAVLPGTIDTPQNRAAMPDADPALWATPREVAEVIAFLVSDAASGVTGAAIPVNGRG